MDKKLIGLIIVVIIAIVTVSGCIGDENSEDKTETLPISENEALTLAKEKFHADNPNFLGEIDENSSFTGVSLTTYNGKEMYNVTLFLSSNSVKNNGVKNDAWTYLLVDANDGTVISSGEYFGAITITPD